MGGGGFIGVGGAVADVLGGGGLVADAAGGRGVIAGAAGGARELVRGAGRGTGFIEALVEDGQELGSSLLGLSLVAFIVGRLGLGRRPVMRFCRTFPQHTLVWSSLYCLSVSVMHCFSVFVMQGTQEKDQQWIGRSNCILPGLRP